MRLLLFLLSLWLLWMGEPSSGAEGGGQPVLRCWGARRVEFGCACCWEEACSSDRVAFSIIIIIIALHAVSGGRPFHQSTYVSTQYGTMMAWRYGMVRYHDDMPAPHICTHMYSWPGMWNVGAECLCKRYSAWARPCLRAMCCLTAGVCRFMVS